MSEAIIIALITGICGVAGQYFISNKKSRENDIKDAQREQRQNDRMEVIERKLDEHNGYAKKFENIEKAIIEISKDVEYLRKS